MIGGREIAGNAVGSSRRSTAGKASRIGVHDIVSGAAMNVHVDEAGSENGIVRESSTRRSVGNLTLYL